jgi:hypothetical protein
MPRHCDWLLIFIAAAGAQQNLTSFIPARTAALINNTAAAPAAAPHALSQERVTGPVNHRPNKGSVHTLAQLTERLSANTHHA